MRALIAMSGGVDSSVAAFLMQQQGYECLGCTMKLYTGLGHEVESGCCSLSDVEDARSVAAKLGMRYYVFNMEEDFHEQVICRFINGYAQGITPNPCIDCNRYLKFGLLYKRAQILGCEKIVTGHYARITYRNGRFLLMKAKDFHKDQSYVLYNMTQEQLAHTVFPLGDFCKQEVRMLAAQQGFVTAEKPDSQDICFVPDGDYAAAIEAMTGRTYPEGDFVDVEGKFLGKHKGIIHYTVGQRKGLGIAASEPLYVLQICPEKNQIILGTQKQQLISSLLVKNVNWIADVQGRDAIPCSIRLRYHQQEQPAIVYPQGSEAMVKFCEPQRGAAPGQAAVFYDGDYVLGGGVIVRR